MDSAMSNPATTTVWLEGEKFTCNVTDVPAMLEKGFTEEEGGKPSPKRAKSAKASKESKE